MKKKLFFILIIAMFTFNNTKVLAVYDDNKDIPLFNNGETKTVQVLSHSTGKTYITNKDVYLMAKVVYAESCGEPHDGKVAVASVILNRVKNPQFPKSIKGVILQRNAFSCVQNGDIKVTPDKDSYNAVIEALKGTDPTNKALFFYNPKIATCTWMKHVNKQNLKVIGNHVFFNAN